LRARFAAFATVPVRRRFLRDALADFPAFFARTISFSLRGGRYPVSPRARGVVNLLRLRCAYETGECIIQCIQVAAAIATAENI
jgi:hypothetical protein